MRKVIILLALVMCACCAFTQNVTVNPYYSTSKDNIMGMDIHVTLPNHLIVGVGGAFALKTYNGTSKVWEENIHILQDYPMDSRDVLPGSPFTMYTKQVSGTVGYNFGDFTLSAQSGIAWRLKYWACNSHGSGSTVMLPNSNPSGAYFTYTKVPAKLLLGAVITMPIHDRWGILVGYNNVEKLKVGVSIRVTPALKIKW